MNFTIGHVLIKTHNFREAVKDFEKLGFQVTYGGNPEKATNALVYFKDESFLELYDAKVGKGFDKLLPLILKVAGFFDKARADRYRNYTGAEEGMNEYALDSVPKQAYTKNMGQLRNTGYPLSPKSYEMKRIDFTGNELHWSITLSVDWRLPFFMSSYQPNISRSEEEVTHTNGVTGIKRLVIGVDDFNYFTQKYDTLYGKGEMGESSCLYRLGDCEILLKKQKYYRIEEIWLKGEKAEMLDMTLTHSAKIYIMD